MTDQEGFVALTHSQVARQERMLEVTARLATDGGLDAVQMRTVAAEADVALGTLYRYFPSKEHLLVSVMVRQIEELGDRLALRPPVGPNASERVIDVLRRSNVALQRRPNFSLAVVRALASGEVTVAPAVREVTLAMRAIIMGAIGHESATPRDELVAEVLEEVWFSALVAWVGGVDDAPSVVRKLEDATRLLLAE